MICNSLYDQLSQRVDVVLFQDSIDLFLGNFAVDESDGPTPLRVLKDWKFLTVSTQVPVSLYQQQM